MGKEPGLHEKIFKMYQSGLRSNHDSEFGSTERNFDRAEYQKSMIKKMIFFFGPYTMTDTGESLF